MKRTWFLSLLVATLWGDLLTTLPYSMVHAQEAEKTPPEGVVPVGADGQPLNLGFETGTLKDWKMEGDAFLGQPIQGDAVAKRRPGEKSLHQGQYWIGGYERRGDKPHGTLTSVPFQVTHPWGSFLIGGGAFANTRVEVVRQDTGWAIYRTSGEKKNTMRRVAFDLQPHLHKEIFVRIVDLESGEWGHVNFDDVSFFIPPKPNATVLPPVGAPRPEVVIEAGGHTAQVDKTFFTADSKELVTVGHDQTIRVWDVESGEMKRVLRPSPFGHGNAAVAPDRKTVALYNGMGGDSVRQYRDRANSRRSHRPDDARMDRRAGFLVRRQAAGRRYQRA